jgi:hypothetical protein
VCVCVCVCDGGGEWLWAENLTEAFGLLGVRKRDLPANVNVVVFAFMLELTII